MAHDLERCPKCKRTGELSSRLMLYVYPENWPLGLLFSVVVVGYGKLIQLGADIYVGFAFLAAIPALMRISRRFSCERCHHEIAEDQEAR